MTEISKKDLDAIVKPGEVLAGKYLVERILGVGGMGVVVAATHTQLDQKVAIKFLLPSMITNREVVERFQREARAAAKIRSQHVVRVSDVGALTDGVPYIVMEFLEGRDLGELLDRRGVLPIPLAVDYVLEACEALAEAHAAGIVHRDLKPANLFLARSADDTEMIKVLDFGISKQISQDAALQSSPSLTKTTDVFGSPTYMSPEQLKASRDVDVRADIWALGVILFEILGGKPPFGGGTVAEIFGAILHQPAPRLRELRKDAPPELERLLLRCLEKDAALRFQNVADLADALMPFGSDAARESTARVSRVLRSGPQSRIGAPAREPGGRPWQPPVDRPLGGPRRRGGGHRRRRETRRKSGRGRPRGDAHRERHLHHLEQHPAHREGLVRRPEGPHRPRRRRGSGRGSVPRPPAPAPERPTFRHGVARLVDRRAPRGDGADVHHRGPGAHRDGEQHRSSSGRDARRHRLGPSRQQDTSPEYAHGLRFGEAHRSPLHEAQRDSDNPSRDPSPR